MAYHFATLPAVPATCLSYNLSHWALRWNGSNGWLDCWLMPKDQPTTDETAARAAWEARRDAYQPHSARAIRAWLEDLSKSAQRLLQLGAYDSVKNGPKRLDPKSAAWRQKLALAQPLKEHERGDLTLVVRLTSELLSRIDADDVERVTVLSLALDLVQAEARSHGELIYRLHAADLEDGRRWQSQDMRLLRLSRIGGRERQKVERATLESVAREYRRQYPRASWSWICTKIARRVQLSASRVRHLLPAAIWTSPPRGVDD